MPILITTDGLGKTGGRFAVDGYTLGDTGLGGFGSGTPQRFKFRRDFDQPRRMKFKAKVKRFEVESKPPEPDFKPDQLKAVQAEIDRLLAMQLELQRQQEAMLLALSSQALIDLLVAEIEAGEAAIAEALIQIDVLNIRLFLEGLDAMIIRLQLMKRRRADEELIVAIIGSGLIH